MYHVRAEDVDEYMINVHYYIIIIAYPIHVRAEDVDEYMINVHYYIIIIAYPIHVRADINFLK